MRTVPVIRKSIELFKFTLERSKSSRDITEDLVDLIKTQTEATVKEILFLWSYFKI